MNQPTTSSARHAARPPDDTLLHDLSLYDRLLKHDLTEADQHGTPVGHVTARRLAIWLAARPQPPDFARALVRFVRTGEITPTLKAELRRHARSATYPHRPHATRLMEYATSRSAAPGPVGQDFGATCHQIDRADLMLADLRTRLKQNPQHPEQTWPDTDGPRIIALARHDPQTNTVSLILDTATADIAMHAITAHATEREAHIREVERYSQHLPDGSWARRNRQAITTRETRVATRLRALERAYQATTGHDTTAAPPATARAADPLHHAADPQIELE
jgi:hypothetical protein